MAKDNFFILHVKYGISPICDWLQGFWPYSSHGSEEAALQAGDELKTKFPGVFEDFKARDRRRTTE